jgi:hypothetical protein
LVYQSGDQLKARPGFGQLLSLYNVRYLITHLPFQVEGFELLGIYGPGAHLYQNLNVMPRAFAVPAYTLADDLTAALDLMASPAFDPTKEVVLFAPPREYSPDPDPASFRSHVELIGAEPLQVTIEAEINQPGFLVLSDLYYPGWEATVDGQPTPIYQANGAVRAVSLDGGAHRVEFRFRPRPLYYGALISGLSALALLVVWRLSRE